jgi:hypothetical protein
VPWLRAHRWYTAVALIGLGFAILITAPHYLSVQSADDANAFRKAVADDGRSRVATAAVIDVGFATAYALFAAAFVSPRAVTRVGAAVVAVGAASDVVENLLVLVGVAQFQRLSEGTVTAMRVCGAAKWTGLIVGFVVLAAGRAWSRHRPGVIGPDEDDCLTV